jgi:hypothetical protein
VPTSAGCFNRKFRRRAVAPGPRRSVHDSWSRSVSCFRSSCGCRLGPGELGALQNTLVYMAIAPISIAIAPILALMVDSRISHQSVCRTIDFLSCLRMAVTAGIIWRWPYGDHHRPHD